MTRGYGVIPAKAGIHWLVAPELNMDSRFRGNDARGGPGCQA
jgi:hypothetical protein